MCRSYDAVAVGSIHSIHNYPSWLKKALGTIDVKTICPESTKDLLMYVICGLSAWVNVYNSNSTPGHVVVKSLRCMRWYEVINVPIRCRCTDGLNP